MRPRLSLFSGNSHGLLIGSGLICGIFTCGLGFIQQGQIWLAVLLYIPANFAFAIGENFLASFLPALAKQDQVGRVSGFSWACAYAAALLLLTFTAGAMVVLKLETPAEWRPFFVFAGLWFIAFTIPTILWLHEPQAPRLIHPGRNLLTAGFVRLAESARETALGFAFYAYLFEAHARSGRDGTYPTWPLWLIGNLLAFGLGSLGSANRAFVSYLAPPNREAEVFGLWGLTWKLSAIMTFPFAWVKDTVGTAEALLVLAGFLTTGIVLTFFVNERRGFEAAREGLI